MVLPFVPVIATIFAWVNLEANSISEIILISFSIIFWIKSIWSGIPGLLIIKSDDNILAREDYFQRAQNNNTGNSNVDFDFFKSPVLKTGNTSE